MNWLPAGLPDWVPSLARALDRQFAPRIPDNPVRLPGVAAADLTAALAARHPYGAAINTDTGRPAYSVLVSGAWAWRYADGSAL